MAFDVEETAQRCLRVRGRIYRDGDLLIVPSPEGIVRAGDGTVRNGESVFLVAYSEQYDTMEIVPLAWVAAERIFGADRLTAEIGMIRPVVIPSVGRD